MRVHFAQCVQGLEFGGTAQPHLRGGGEYALQVIEKIVMLAVEGMQAFEEPWKMTFQTLHIGLPLDRLGLRAEARLQPGH